MKMRVPVAAGLGLLAMAAATSVNADMTGNVYQNSYAVDRLRLAMAPLAVLPTSTARII